MLRDRAKGFFGQKRENDEDFDNISTVNITILVDGFEGTIYEGHDFHKEVTTVYMDNILLKGVEPDSVVIQHNYIEMKFAKSKKVKGYFVESTSFLYIGEKR